MNLERLQEEFLRNFEERGDLGASVSVWRDGQEVVKLGGGFQDRENHVPWTPETPVLFWSATKGMSSACLLHACQEAGVPISRRVADFWPEFGAAGKAEIRIDEMMSHQAGLPAISQEAPVQEYGAVVAALEAEAPLWPLGEGHGYHPRTIGFLTDELLRRITGGRTMGEYWRTQFKEPMELDLWIGMPPAKVSEVAPIYPARRGPPKGDPFYTAFATIGSPTNRAFSSPKGLHSVASMQTEEARTASFAAFGGIGSARSLARFYEMLANGGTCGGRVYFQPETLEQMATTLTQGMDRVLLTETAFSAGFMKDPTGPDGRKLRQAFGPSATAFGHPGAGGSHAFADPEHRISFAYVMNQMEPGVLPGDRSLKLVEALYELH